MPADDVLLRLYRAHGARPPLRPAGHRADQAGPARRLPVRARPGGVRDRRGRSRCASRTGCSRPTATRSRSSPGASTRSRCSSLLRGDWHCGYDPHALPRRARSARRWPPTRCTPSASRTPPRLKGEDTVALVLLGDGATSEGDTHEALNFAAVFKAPVVFFVQNNGYAISVPLAKQTARAVAGPQGHRLRHALGVLVDGNDAAAVYAVVSDAVARGRARRGPDADRGAHLPDRSAHQRRRRHPLPRPRRGRRLAGHATRSTACATYLTRQRPARRRRRRRDRPQRRGRSRGRSCARG